MQDLLGRVTSPGDMAAILLGGAAGYTLDAALNVAGFFEPGICGAVTASGCLGAKKFLEAQVATFRSYRAGRRESEQRALDAGRALQRTQVPLEAVDRAWALVDHILDAGGDAKLAERLQQELKLHKAGITNEQSLDEVIEAVLREYRT